MDTLRPFARWIGLIFFVVGLVLRNFGISGFGVVVLLSGFIPRPSDT